ncbi:hypothetical protein BGW38_003047 [Lunasporangiospora selenospora]|uniref:Disease resistance R13L4/SHOC-2-like LRR domain-containing protein n=1 Tax=Lunasporangiospora selenospora TaxID=979761 RepID=A0A9P6G0M0_9FUNG|nr:hypothetical protein BGW38_003047 [Lunasporangiospora selenospora]
MDIESCIDNPVLAPLGRHVNKRKSSSRRRDEDHIDINVMPQTSSSAFIQERERESHSPVTSLILRRRRLDCEQLSQYLQNLQPAFDPLTMSILRTPLLHLTELDLSRNRLVSLPKDLTAMVPHLSYLNLSHNQFADVPLELCRLTNLQVLIMSQNRIQGPFPHQICSSLTQLKNLRLCANEITSLPHTMARLDKLESLSMGSVYGGNLLTTFPANCIQHMKALRELDLSHNKLCLLPADIGHPHSHLRQLSASDNKLEAIPKSIGYCRELRSLILGRNQLTSLPTEIADLMQLDTLDLSENLLCVIPGDVADFLTKTTLLLTGNPFTRGYCDANRNPVGEIGGLGIHHPTMDDDRYATLLKSLSRRAILNSAASSSSSAGNGSLPTMASFGGVGIGGAGGAGWAGSSQGSGMPSPGLSSGRESPRFGPSHTEGGYEMDHDERLDYHLYYTRHALSSSSRPPSRAESINSVNEFGGGTGSDYGSVYGGSWMDPFGSGTGASTPRVNAEAVIADIDAFFEFLPAIPSRAEASRTGSVAPPTRAGSGSNLTTTTTISLNTTQTEPSIFEGTSLLASPSSTVTSPLPLQQLDAALNNIQLADPLSVSPRDQADVSQNDTQQAGVESSVNMDPETPAALFEAPVRSFFPSLQELAARAVLFHGEPLPLELLPEMVIDYLQPGARPCGLCRQPYVKEWVSSVRVKSYLGHPAVARRVRFCSFMCWKQASEQLEAEEANEGSSLLGMPVVQPGQITGHLPPVVMSALYDETGEKILRNNTMGRDRGSVSSRSSVSSQEEEFSQLLTDSVLISPPLSSSTSSTASFPPPGSGMRVCKGGQTYWPVIGRQLRRASSSTSATTKTGVCARGCLGGGVCEW